MRGFKMAAAAVANVKNDYLVVLDGVEHAVLIGLATIHKLAHIKRKLLALRGQGITVRQFGKRRYGVFQFEEPVQGGFACALLE